MILLSPIGLFNLGARGLPCDLTSFMDLRGVHFFFFLICSAFLLFVRAELQLSHSGPVTALQLIGKESSSITRICEFTTPY